MINVKPEHFTAALKRHTTEAARAQISPSEMDVCAQEAIRDLGDISPMKAIGGPLKR